MPPNLLVQPWLAMKMGCMGCSTMCLASGELDMQHGHGLAGFDWLSLNALFVVPHWPT